MFGRNVGKRKMELFGWRIDSAEFHGGADEILLVVVGLGVGDILVHDQSPLFPVGDDVDAVGADGEILRDSE